MTTAPDGAVASQTSFRLLVAAEVRAQMAREQVSNRRFAAKLGLKPAWVDRRLNGTTPMDADDMELFANALGVTLRELLANALAKSETSIESRVTYHGSDSGNPHENVVDLAERRHASGPIDQVEAA